MINECDLFMGCFILAYPMYCEAVLCGICVHCLSIYNYFQSSYTLLRMVHLSRY